MELSTGVTVIWHWDIYDYGFDGHFFTMLAIQFFGQIWSQNLHLLHAEFFLLLNDPNSFSETWVLE